MSVTFTSPAPGSRTIIMPNPELQDVTGSNLRIRVKYDMTGIIRTIARSPAYHTLRMIWDGLRRAKAEEFMDFLTTEAGKLLTFTNHDSLVYEGNIVTRLPKMIFQRRGIGSLPRKESLSIEIEFIGDRI